VIFLIINETNEKDYLIIAIMLAVKLVKACFYVILKVSSGAINKPSSW
jgi:hypothetical protein